MWSSNNKKNTLRSKGEVLSLFERGLTQLGAIRRCLDQCTKDDPRICELSKCPSDINNVIVGPQSAKIVFDAYRNTAPELNELVYIIRDEVYKLKEAIESIKYNPGYSEEEGRIIFNRLIRIAINKVDETTIPYKKAITYIKTHPLASLKTIGGSRKRTHHKRKHHKRTHRKHRK